MNADGSQPIYVQLADWLEGQILTGAFRPQDKMYSQYQLADMFTINPATAAKGLNRLVERNILFKKRGLGMFVTEEAVAMIQEKRKNETLYPLVESLVQEASQLGVPMEEVIQLLHNAHKKGEGS